MDHRTLTGLPASNQVYRWSPSCSGVPTCTANATVASGCSPYTSTLSLTGLPACINGLTYQWQSSPDNVTWANVPGATNATYSASVTVSVYYRCVVMCSGSGLSFTTASIFLNLGTPAGGITGLTIVCAGSTTLLSDGTPGGSWSSSSSGIASVGSSSGVVTGGVSAGTATITYTLGSGCYSTTTVSVVTTPTPISGPAGVCTGATVILTEATGGGTWSSSTTSVATISSTGTVYGITSGTTTITYSLGSCTATRVEVVNPTPPSIVGLDSVCYSSSITMTDSITGGTWSTVYPGAVTVTATTGVVTGVASGPAIVTYTAPGGCITVKTVTVNSLPSMIVPTTLCVGSSSPIFGIPGGGSWSSSTTSVATIDPVAFLLWGASAGTATISYTLPDGCSTSSLLNVLPLPGPIGGVTSLCVGSTGVLTDGNERRHVDQQQIPAVSTTDFFGNTGGVSAGIDTISYMLTTGCEISETFTVDPAPPVTTGAAFVCAGGTVTLTDALGGGTWTSGSTAIATVVPGTGVVHGVSAGLVTITYTGPSGCSTTTDIERVPAPPSPITGTLHVCMGQTTILGDISKRRYVDEQQYGGRPR